jgi:UPF0755 protein
MGKYFKIFLFVILAAAVIAVFLDVFKNNPQKEGFFVISRGDNILQIAGNLQKQGYIGSRIVFISDAVSSGNFRKMKAGRYQIKKGSTDGDLIENFTKFQSLPINISVPPGKTTNDIAGILERAHLAKKTEFLSLVLNDSKTNQADFYSEISQKYPFLSDKPEDAGLEGYLYPDNYLIDISAPNQDIAKQMLDNFDKKMTEDLRGGIKKQKKTIFSILTMASILEKEVKTYNDKQVVAGILWKRADNNLPLEVDSTLLYFLTSAHPSAIDKTVESPYNTYKYAGLPKGPICNPGIESIKAAIYPKNSDYWFYLSTKAGETIFAETLGQHLINKAKYLTN